MRFAALRAPWYKGYLFGGSLGMAGDHLEHAITYWVLWQAFESPLLAGFAVVSHWLPHLLFGVTVGALADRYDCRRIVQLAQGLFALASIGWAIVILTGTLAPWNAVLLLLLHGFASALWGPAEQMLIYDIVGPDDLPSGVRLMATSLNLGMLVGPLLGAALLFTVGPAIGLLINVALYLPFIVYLAVLPFTGHERRLASPRARLGLRETVRVLSLVPRYPSVLVAFVLQGAVGFFIGTALLPLLPDFGELLGATDSALGYGALIAAMSVGAVAAGVGVEAIGRIRAGVPLLVASVLVLGVSLMAFALSGSLVLSVAMLVLAGAATLISLTTSQTIVQLDAPEDQRGRFLGAFSMTSMGLRLGSGVIVGLLASIVGPAAAIGIDALALTVLAIVVLVVVVARRRPVSSAD